MKKEEYEAFLNWYLYEYYNDSMEWPETCKIVAEYMQPKEVFTVCKRCGKAIKKGQECTCDKTNDKKLFINLKK